MQLAKPGVLVQACSDKRIAAGSRPAWDTVQETLSPEKKAEPVQLANDIVICTFQYNLGELGNGSHVWDLGLSAQHCMNKTWWHIAISQWSKGKGSDLRSSRSFLVSLHETTCVWVCAYMHVCVCMYKFGNIVNFLVLNASFVAWEHLIFIDLRIAGTMAYIQHSWRKNALNVTVRK